ncbi:MAG: substrate-binding domain-containing protein [Magnetococcales bacterium]|nr:substrate-binding domain-containing protein [Magnetococcales bacterium]
MCRALNKKILKCIGGFLFFAIFILADATSVVADNSVKKNKAQSIIIAGTGDSESLLRLIAKRFEKDNSSSDITVYVPDSIGSGGGILALKKGVVQLARTARPIKKREREGLISIPFAISPVVFAVHPTVMGIDGLTSHDILAIYSGQIKNWSELGGVDHKIYVVEREHGDSSLRALGRTFAGWRSDLQIGKMYYSTATAAKAVANHPYTIGYLPLSIALGSGLKVLNIDGKAPDESNIVSGEYPYILYFELVAKKPVAGWEKKFISYMFSPKIRMFMKKIGVYPIRGGLPPGL